MSDTRFGLSIWDTYANGKPKISENTPAGGIEPYLLQEERTGVLLDPAVGFEGTGIAIPYISESTNDHRPRDPIKITEPVRLDAVGAHIKNSYPPWMITDVEHPPKEKITTLPTNTEINMFYNTRPDGTPSGQIYYDFQYNRFSNTPFMYGAPELQDVGMLRSGTTFLQRGLEDDDDDISSVTSDGSSSITFVKSESSSGPTLLSRRASVVSSAGPVPEIKLDFEPINATLQRVVTKLEEANQRDRDILKSFERLFREISTSSNVRDSKMLEAIESLLASGASAESGEVKSAIELLKTMYHQMTSNTINIRTLNSHAINNTAQIEGLARVMSSLIQYHSQLVGYIGQLEGRFSGYVDAIMPRLEQARDERMYALFNGFMAQAVAYQNQLFFLQEKSNPTQINILNQYFTQVQNAIAVEGSPNYAVIENSSAELQALVESRQVELDAIDVDDIKDKGNPVLLFSDWWYGVIQSDRGWEQTREILAQYEIDAASLSAMRSGTIPRRFALFPDADGNLSLENPQLMTDIPRSLIGAFVVYILRSGRMFLQNELSRNLRESILNRGNSDNINTRVLVNILPQSDEEYLTLVSMSSHERQEYYLEKLRRAGFPVKLSIAP